MNVSSVREPVSALRIPRGQNYLRFLADMQRELQPEWYLEVGTQFGKSLDVCTGNSVAIDPHFQPNIAAARTRKATLFLQQPSDEAFASGLIQNLGVSFDLAFLDGMHLFEFLLRDFINTERLMSKGGHIVLHDCLPHNRNMAERDRAMTMTNAWTGDVWKLVPILQEMRPDLTVRVFDAAPTGLVVVSGLNPSSTVLADKYVDIEQAYMIRDDVDDVVAGFDVLSTRDSAWRPKRPAVVASNLSFDVQTAVPRPRGQVHWGDFHFANGLASALERQGHKARVQTRKEWLTQTDVGDVEIILRGNAPYTEHCGGALIYWVISTDGEDLADELSCADYIFTAGRKLSDHLAGRLGSHRVGYLPQAFDADRISPAPVDQPRDGIVFVGLARRFERPTVSAALEAGLNVSLWGRGWEAKAPAEMVRGERIGNHALGKLYRESEIVLNDHKPGMRQWDLVSNRIFDALAAGAPVISDPIGSIPDDLRDFVSFAETAEDMHRAVARIRGESVARRQERYDLAMSMRETHSFDQRASEIVARAKAVLSQGRRE